MKAFFASPRLLRLIIFFLNIVIALLSGNVIGNVLSQFIHRGALVSWEPIAESMKFNKIVDATTHVIWAQAANGLVYYHNGPISYGGNYCSNQMNYSNECLQALEHQKEWFEIQRVPFNVHDSVEKVERSNLCNFSGFEFHQPIPGKIIECLRTDAAGPKYSFTSYYVLLEDGTVWVWGFDSSLYFYVEVFVVGIGIILGFIVGVISFIFCMKYLVNGMKKER